MYLSGLAFLANLTPPNKQFFKLKSESKSLDHVSREYKLCLFVLSSLL